MLTDAILDALHSRAARDAADEGRPACAAHAPGAPGTGTVRITTSPATDHQPTGA